MSYRGFSTLEILIALAIFSLTMTAVVVTALGTPSLLEAGMDREQAYQRAGALLDSLYRKSLTSFESVEDVATSTDGMYQIVAHMSLLDDVTKRVLTTVSWTDAQNLGHTISLPLILTDYANASPGEHCDALLAGPDATIRISRPYALRTGDLLPSGVSVSSSFGSTTLAITGSTLLLTAESTANAKDSMFYAFDISDAEEEPHFLSALDTLPTSTNGAAASFAAGSYVYLASASTCQSSSCGQLQIIDIHDVRNPKVVAQFVLATSSSPVAANSIAYRSGVVYLGLRKTSGTSGQEFILIDVHNPLAPTYLGGLHIGYTLNDISLSRDGRLAHIATTDNRTSGQALQTIDITNPATPRVVSGTSQPGAGYAEVLRTAGDLFFLGRSTAKSSKELYMFSNAAGGLLQSPSGVDTNGSVRGIRRKDTRAYVLTTNELSFWNIESQTALTAARPAYSLRSLGMSGSSLACRGHSLYVSSTDSSGAAYLTVLTNV